MVGKCDMTEPAKQAPTFKILRAIGMDLAHKQAYLYTVYLGTAQT